MSVVKKFVTVAVFVYNRPEHALNTLKALQAADLSKDTPIIIYADGPKIGASQEDLERIAAVREVIQSENWSDDVQIVSRETNIGLAASIIGGVSEILSTESKVIVLEDDIVVSRSFLRYMNEALDLFENDSDVMHVSGYMYPYSGKLPDYFFYNVPLCWGWATWARAWKYFIPDSVRLLNEIEHKIGWDAFNKFDGKDLENQLRKNAAGQIRTWFVKWYASVLLAGGYCLFPGRSYVNNIGFDNSGENCFETDHFKNETLSTFMPLFSPPKRENKIAAKKIREHYDRLNHIPSNNWLSQLKKTAFADAIRKMIRLSNNVGR